MADGRGKNDPEGAIGEETGQGPTAVLSFWRLFRKHPLTVESKGDNAKAGELRSSMVPMSKPMLGATYIEQPAKPSASGKTGDGRGTTGLSTWVHNGWTRVYTMTRHEDKVHFQRSHYFQEQQDFQHGFTTGGPGFT
ncbi:hypothetical protein FPV67DRAFT_1455550 [Lyophyllum atratum]|nr:hypothetical protein FPV67DRAFT_1455550 [Lyophyllum atratum]